MFRSILDLLKATAMKWNLTILVSVFLLMSLASQTWADIDEWAYVNPSDPTQGVYQSSVVCPGGAGVFAVPNANLSSLDLTQAYLIGANLTNASVNNATLTNANLTNANLTNTQFFYSTLTNANLTGATVVETNFGPTNVTPTQLYSTASYQAQNLQGIGFAGDDLTNWNFSGQNLTNASLQSTNLTNANLANANLTNASLQSTNLTNANLANANLTNASVNNATLTNANLTNANLTNTQFFYSTLTNANLTGATVVETNFGPTNVTPTQLYSTASYQAQNLQGIGFAGDDLTNWNFSGQNLTNASLQSTNLTNANLANANLTNANLTNANLTGVDLRGAQGFAPGSATLTNAILTDGTIQGLYLTSSNPTLLIRNYSGNIPIHVLQAMSMSPGTSLVFQFDNNVWGSVISFDSGIPVTLGGNLELGLAPGINPASLVGDSFHLFDWTGVSPAGQFANITNDLPSGYTWDTSQLYNDGEVTLDESSASGGSVPEPSSLVVWAGLGAMGLIACAWQRRRSWLSLRRAGR